MESVDLEMNDVFGEEIDDNEDIGAVGALPDLPESTQFEDTEDTDNAEVDKRLKALSKGAAKKVVRNPQPKLDATRLTGDRGIPILPKIGEKIKFKGKNHEAEDLGLLMRHMEHWAHRLFPKMPFDEIIQRVEKLGSKGPVKTCVRKIRLDMPVLPDEFVGSEPEDDVERNGEDVEREERNAEAMWDELIEEEAELRAMEAEKQQKMARKDDSTMEIDEQQDITSGKTSAEDKHDASQTQTPAAQKLVANGAFTPEQLERMERNKQLALERKMKKSRLMSPALKRPDPSSSEIFIATPIQQTLKETSEVPSQTRVAESGNQLSEVIEQGPSQNIQIVQKQDDAQRWFSQSASAKNENEDMSLIHVNEEVSSQSQLQDTENQLSEVIEQGPSQNIQLEQKQDDPQGRCSQILVFEHEDGDISQKQATDEHSLQEDHTKESINQTKDNKLDSDTVSRSSDVNDGSIQVNDSTFQVNDSMSNSNDLSEIIPKQNSENIVLKPVSRNNNGEQEVRIEKKNFSETLQSQDNKDDKENIGNKNNFEKSSTKALAVDEFDDELSEEKLGESLDF